jgi:hypothetical protein
VCDWKHFALPGVGWYDLFAICSTARHGEDRWTGAMDERMMNDRLLGMAFTLFCFFLLLFFCLLFLFSSDYGFL